MINDGIDISDGDNDLNIMNPLDPFFFPTVDKLLNRASIFVRTVGGLKTMMELVLLIRMTKRLVKKMMKRMMKRMMMMMKNLLEIQSVFCRL